MVRKLITILILILPTLLDLSSLYAQSPSAYIDIQPRYGDTNDQFTFSIAVEGASRVGPPYLTGGDGFKVDFRGSGQKISSSSQGLVQVMIFNYTLTPKKDGLIDSPGVEIEVDGKTISINPIQVKISKAKEVDLSDKENQSVFLNQNLSSNSVYVGEQLIHSLELYSRIPIFEINAQTESFDGFWSVPHGDPKQGRVLLNGSPIRVTRWTTSIFPLKEGALSIEPRTVKAKVRSKSRPRGLPLGPLDFDDPDTIEDLMGFGTFKEEQFSSEKAHITVKALPEKPENFPSWKSSNLVVGKTSIEIDHTSDEVEIGESRTITIQISSFGNLSPFTEVPIPESTNYKVYQEAAKEEKELVGDKIRTTKIYRVSIVPLQAGNISLGNIRFGYFDPETSRYDIAESPPINFKVTGQEIAPSTDKSEEDIVTTNTIPPVVPTLDTKYENQNLKYEEESKLGKISKSISLPLAILIISALIVVSISIYAISSIIIRKRPQKEAISKIMKAVSINELREALIEYLRAKYKFRTGHLSNSEISAIIDKKVNDTSLKFQIELLFDEFDHAQFGKEKLVNDELIQSLKKRIKSAIITLN